MEDRAEREARAPEKAEVEALAARINVPAGIAYDLLAILRRAADPPRRPWHGAMIIAEDPFAPAAARKVLAALREAGEEV